MNGMFEQVTGKGSGLLRKAVVLFILAVVLPIVIITIVVNVIYYHGTLALTRDLALENEQIHSRLVKERLDSYDNVLFELVTDRKCISLSKKIDGESSSDRVTGTKEMRKLLEDRGYANNDIQSFVFIANNGEYCSYHKFYGSTYDYIWSDKTIRMRYYDLVDQNQKLSYIGTSNQKREQIGEDYVILLGIPVRDLRTKQQSGVLLMTLKHDILTMTAREEEPEAADMRIVVDEDDSILAGTSAEYLLKSLKELKTVLSEKGRWSDEMRVQIPGTQWSIVSMIRMGAFDRSMLAATGLILAAIFLITLLFSGSAFLYIRLYIGKVHKISEGIRQYSGLPGERISVDLDERDELYVIVGRLREMSAKLEATLLRLEEQNEKMLETATKRRHAEIKALEAQINPHFLYNTLDSINWRAIEHGEEEISDMLGTLGSLLRYSVSNIDILVTLEAEIQWVEKYVMLQRERFEDSFDCHFEIQREVRSYPVYKMLLQPLVENAILHAFEGVKKGGLIVIRGSLRGDGKLSLQVNDNGCGMAPEMLERIRQNIREKTALQEESIGIGNVINRLEVYYQEDADIRIDSRPGQGTSIELIIPYREEVQA